MSEPQAKKKPLRLKTLTLPAYLEVRAADGSTSFYALNQVLQSPRLQQQCIEKAKLRGVIAKLRRHGLLDLMSLAMPEAGRVQ